MSVIFPWKLLLRWFYIMQSVAWNVTCTEVIPKDSFLNCLFRLTFQSVMSRNGQTHFQSLYQLLQDFYGVSDHFGTFWIMGLKVRLIFIFNFRWLSPYSTSHIFIKTHRTMSHFWVSKKSTTSTGRLFNHNQIKRKVVQRLLETFRST